MSSIRTLDLRSASPSEQELAKLLPRAKLDISAASKLVASIVDDVKVNGLAAIKKYAVEFDGFDPEPIRVSKAELEAALSALAPELRSAIEQAIERVRLVSVASLPKDIVTEVSEGAEIRQRYVPMDSVGLYAPGGKAVYPSSVIMNVVPAQVAGVKTINLASPGQKDFAGRPHPTVLATAALLGVENVFCMGGASAISAFAYGVPEINLEPVSLITGPGNVYVAAAKRLVRGDVAIDSEAGTTEIMIIADDSANPVLVAADLISQAEHDEAAAAVLVTDSSALAEKVTLEIARQLAETKHQERIKAALSGLQSAIVLVDSMEQAIKVANDYATEHLELVTRDNESVLTGIKNAGAIFMGEYSPVSLGDYMAGSNHVLPTGGSAKFSSGLGVHTFLKIQQVINYNESALADLAQKLPIFADAEDLPAHGQAVSRRFSAK